MTESEFQANVIDLAHMLGWRVTHFRPAKTKHGWRTPLAGDPGFPDLVLARGGRVIFAELKSERGRLTADQEAWLDQLAQPVGPQVVERIASHEVYVWRPSHVDHVARVLRW